MKSIDIIVLVIYAIGITYIGSILAKRNKTTADMFAVKKQSPWWLSGLSAFMSAFSAGTFVVWGGVAYKHGMVAVSILMCSGISSFLVGRYFAQKWASLNITSVGQYLEIRFGKSATLFYTWVGMLFKLVAMAVALYSFAVLASSLMKLSPDNIMVNEKTGTFSVSIAIILSGIFMIMYAVSGGLWAVLIIDAIQFVVLSCIVLFVVPLSFMQVGGIQAFIQKAPSGFLFPVGGGFSFLFLVGWILVHTFKLGGEWVFVQRFLSVNTPSKAKKASYLFGALYMISPIIWMLPPMIFRIINPNVAPEQAYILACAKVLPAGMIGLLIASMFSSAASYIDGEINVYAGAITNDIYKPYINPEATDKKLVLVGRFFSVLIGGLIVLFALSIPYLGGAEQIILLMTSLLVVAMVLPVLWGLYFGKVKKNAIWVSTTLTFIVSLCLKSLSKISDNKFVNYYHLHVKTIDVFVGLLFPILTLTVMELLGRTNSFGFIALRKIISSKEVTDTFQARSSASLFPAKILSYSIAALSIIMFGLSLITVAYFKFQIILFATVLLGISLLILCVIYKKS